MYQAWELIAMVLLLRAAAAGSPALKARAMGLLVLLLGAQDAEGCGAHMCLSTRS